jgi:hypothetical protein
MKNSRMFIALALFSILPSFANTYVSVSTCTNRVSFFGLVTVWSGSIKTYEYDQFGNATGNVTESPCTSDGNWDWFW